MAPAELLRDILKLARVERALEGKGLRAFALALEERAQLVLAERVGPLEERIRGLDEQVRGLEDHVHSLERESAWRAETIAGLEEQVRSLAEEDAWRRETIASLEAQVHWLVAENDRRKETVAYLEPELAAARAENGWRTESMANLETVIAELRAEREKVALAHESLLGHHRELVTRVAAELRGVAGLPFYRVAEARRRLSALAEALAREAS